MFNLIGITFQCQFDIVVDHSDSEMDPPPSPTLESVDSSRPLKQRMNIAFLCNPGDEDQNLRGHHMSQLFSDELDVVEKRALAEGSSSERTLISLIL
jgi:hypothetical protein